METWKLPSFKGASNRRSANMININENKKNKDAIEMIKFLSPMAAVLVKYVATIRASAWKFNK